MSRETIAENLGTIAKSGSKEFKDVIDQDMSASNDAASEIIG
jgi:HSP90 family molecular chaperone